MPKFNCVPGKRYRFVMEGVVTYNTGGFVGIAYEAEEVGGVPGIWEPVDPQGGYLDMMEPFIVEDPVEVGLYPDGTFFLVIEEPDGWRQRESTTVVIYHREWADRVTRGNPWFKANDHGSFQIPKGAKMVRLHREDE